MPIYAYRCRACGQEFETLVRSNDVPECPACGTADLDRQLSLIAQPAKAAGGAAAEFAGAACANAGCGAGGVCPMQAQYG